jgi:hypothetical protein
MTLPLPTTIARGLASLLLLPFAVIASDNAALTIPAEGNGQCQNYAINSISQLSGPGAGSTLSDGTNSASYSLGSGGTVLSFSGAVIPIDYAVIKRSNEIQLFYYRSGGVTADANIQFPSGRSISSFALCYGLNNTAVNQSPVASFTATCSERNCQFDASGSIDAEGGTLTYGWDFGDGMTGSGATVNHVFTTSGTTFTVVLTITDPLGGVSTAEQMLTLAEPVPPTLPTCSLFNNGGYAGDEASAIDNTTVTCDNNQASLVCNFEWTKATAPTDPEQNFGLNNTGTCCWCNPENVDGGAITGKVCFPDEPYVASDPQTLGCPPIDVKEFNQILLLKNGGRVCYVRDGRTVCYY